MEPLVCFSVVCSFAAAPWGAAATLKNRLSQVRTAPFWRSQGLRRFMLALGAWAQLMQAGLGPKLNAFTYSHTPIMERKPQTKTALLWGANPCEPSAKGPPVSQTETSSCRNRTTPIGLHQKLPDRPSLMWRNYTQLLTCSY